MKSRRLKKIIAVTIVSTIISTIVPNSASAEWLQNADNNWSWMEDGNNATGWKQINGSWYFFDEKGKMETGWIQTTDSKWYYLNSDGSMKTGWLYDTDGKWYNLAPSGEMRTGWIYDTDGSIYFTDSSGAMQTGVIQVEGKSYVLGESGAMLIGNNILFENGIYKTDDKGVIIEGNTSIGSRTYTNEGILIIPNTNSNADTNKSTSAVDNSSNNTETSSSSSSSSAKKKISKIDTISDIEVANGTELDEVGLPSSVYVTLSNNTKRSVTVIWDKGNPEYDGDSEGTYTFTGTIKLPSRLRNPKNLKASVNVHVKGLVVGDKTILSVEELSDIIVVNGTELDEVGLPNDIDIKLSDNTTTSAAVTWNEGTPSYDSSVLGNYEFIGTITLPSGVTNPNNIKARINVNVQKALIGVQPVSNITVAYGTELSSLGLPSNATITLNDNTIANVAVTWDVGTPNYDGRVAGTYTFTGTLNLPSGVSNPNNIEASVNVVVEGLLSSPFAASVDGDGNVYIASMTTRNVIKYNSNGIYQYTISDGLSSIAAVTATTSGMVYVSDYGNNRIVRYDSNGNIIGTPLTYSGSFYPVQVALDSEGNIYAGRDLSTGLVKFNSTGQYVSTLGSTTAWAVAIDKHDNIYTASTGGTITKMTSDGTVIATYISEAYNIHEMVCDSVGNLYMMNYINGNIIVMDSSGTVIKTITNTGISQYSSYSISIDDEDNLYVVDTRNNRVVKFDNDGNYIREFK